MEPDIILRERCRVCTNTEGDRFVGVRETPKGVTVCFPLGYRLSASEEGLRRDVLQLMSVLEEFLRSPNALAGMGEQLPQFAAFPAAACLELISSQMDLDWNDKLHTLTLSFRGQSAVSQFPAEVAPGRLTLGHMCLFYESQGAFYMTMDAWSDVLEESLAVFRAEVAYDGEDFTLQNLQMDSMAGV